MVAQTRTAGHSSPRKLKFHEKLVGKGLSTDALQKKLKALHTELADMDQEVVDVASLSAVRKELINTSILLHKDRGVKAYTACCLADLLRLYAPDAPYTENELRDIFQFFVKQLTAGLKGSDSAYYSEYFHLLESLSTVKSVVLVCDLPNADDLMVEIFRGFFGLVRRDLAKKIELFMADIMIALIDECQNLPQEVLESMMAQFMDTNTGMDQPAYRLAVQVCNQTADKLQRHVCQYFTDLIVQHSRDEEFQEVQAAHELVKKLNRSCPSLLHNVVPQLEEELRVEENQIRIMATQVLGEMFADKGGAEFVKKYPTTWNVWLQRKNDKASVVRLAFVEAIKGVLVNLPDVREAVEEALGTKLFDPDDKVRAAVCRLYSQLDYEIALHHVSEAQLRSVAGRGLDKKQHVRVEAMTAVARLYSLAYPEIENNDTAAIKQFAWIPETILQMSWATTEVRAIAEQVLAEYILPLPISSSSKNTDIDEGVWTDRFLLSMKFLDETAVNGLLSFSGLKGQRPSNYEHYLQCCVENNGGIIDNDEEAVTEKLTFAIKRLSNQFPDPQKAAEDLAGFAKLNDGRLFKLLKTCMDTQTDLKTLVKSIAEFLRRTEQSSASIVPTMALVVRRGSLWLLNQSSIPTLVKRVQKGDPAGDGYGSGQAQISARNAHTCMNYISKHCPAILKAHVAELSKAIADEKNIRLVEVSLQALSAVANWDNKLAPADRRTVDRLMRFVMDSNVRHAKFSARTITCTKNAGELCGQVIDAIAEEISDADPELLVAHVAVLQQLSLKAPESFERKSEVIMAFLIKELLMSASDIDPEAMDADTDWVDNNDMTPRLKAKILALKVCRNRCFAHASSDSAVDIAKPVLKMFTTLLHYDGSLTADAEDDQWTKTRLRLQAAVSLLHLSRIEAFATANAPNFVLLALTIQDPSYQVRVHFIDKLTALLLRRLPTYFNVIPFLTIHDPEAVVKNKAKAYIVLALRNLPKGMRLASFEMMFIRLLHVLAHHPDFALTEEKLPEIAQYINFYLDLVISAENVSLLYHLAMKAKTVRDAESHAFSENLYAISELAQHLIKNRAKARSWSLESYPGKVRLPPDILRPLPNAQAANEILKRVYLPENTLTWLAEQAKLLRAENKEKQPRAERKTAGKRKAAPKANGNAKRVKRRKAEETDEESDPSESDEDDQEKESSDKEEDESQSEQEVEEPQHEEKLGRGARTRAKAKIKQQVKKSTKRKPKAPSSDD